MFSNLEGTECVLTKALEHAASELGSQTLAVLVEEDACIEIAFSRAEPGQTCGYVNHDARCWPATAIDYGGETSLVPAETPAARFLTSAIAPAAQSFLLFAWRAQRRAVIIVFGFVERDPLHQSIPARLVEGLNLAALAAWSLKEVDRLRAELRSVNDRFAGRKLVERAKCVLQAERGMDEQQAYEHLRKLSRQRRIPMAKLAEGLLGAPRS